MSKPNSHRNYSQNRPREHQPSTVPRPVPTNETSAAYDSEFPSLLAEHQRTDNQERPITAGGAGRRQSGGRNFFQSNHAGVHRTGQPLIPLTAFMPQPANAPAQPAAAAAVAADMPAIRPLSAREDEVHRKICEIILTIHESRKFVSRERVQGELFRFYNVSTWPELGVHPARLNALMNLTDRQKSVGFYMSIFEQTFNLCTLNDLDALLAQFMKVGSYAELRLGPLEQNPDVLKVFQYKPTDVNQPIPAITTGRVITLFMDFLRANRNRGQVPFDGFLDVLVKKHGLQSRQELGVFCKSFPFFVQVTSNVRRDCDQHAQHAHAESRTEMIDEVRTRLTEFKTKMADELELSSFNKKKTPTAVFNYLISIVDKYLDFLPQQPVLHAILTQLRDDELSRCLLNMCIYLGTLEKPEDFIPELKRLGGFPDGGSPKTAPLMPSEWMSKKDRKKMQAMMQQQQSQSASVTPNTSPNDQTATASAPLDTSFASSLLPPYRSKPKPPVSLTQLCSAIRDQLVRYDTVLTIKQLLKIEENLCAHFNVDDFSAFNYDEGTGDDHPPNLVSLLDAHRQQIDPHGELAIYGHAATSGASQEELYAFVRQLSIFEQNDGSTEHREYHAVSSDTHSSADHRHISGEKLSAVDKAVKHKFSSLTHFPASNQIVRRVEQQRHKVQPSIIRFEESLLDLNGLNRLNVCPTSLDVDEAQLCQLILHCPLMADLNSWLQWLDFFQPKYGTLKSFISKNSRTFRDLNLLETSSGELIRLPSDAKRETFEAELHALRIRSAVGHLCALIVHEGLITRFPFNVYRTTMESWFRHLRTLAKLQDDPVDPMQHILDFIVYLPTLCAKSRLIEELILAPLDGVFGNDNDGGVNPRASIWRIANAQQREKLELLGHTVNVTEWRNEKKWSGEQQDEEVEEGVQERLRTDLRNALFERLTTSLAHDPTANVASDGTPDTAKVDTPAVAPETPAASETDGETRSSSAAFDHIESIRRGFGMDSALDPIQQSTVNNLRGILERSLEKLSNDLFSDQGHFVLELVQNADDNHYTDHRLPTLRFILSPERVLVCNNEIGFEKSNIAAICNVGASTKGKHKQGYVGHKGIGFKSVFMVSHRPEIHSRDYHIRFDTADGKQQIGYIRPIWVDQYEEELPDANEWTTCIRLPIRPDIQRERLQRNFSDIHGRLLLFLNRLREIQIMYQEPDSSTNAKSRIFTRIDHAQGQIIELQEKLADGSTVDDYWLVVKKMLKVPTNIKDKLRDVKGEVESTVIAIAYPLNGIRDASTRLPPQQPLFAYLPLRPYGFRFIVQADFEITASRQEMRRDSLWNEWLKMEMPCLLSLAYLQFKALPELLASSTISSSANHSLSPIETTKYFINMIPSRSELDAYFNAFVDESIKLLTGIIELPVVRHSGGEQVTIDWVSPSKCVIVPDPFIRKILSEDLLVSHFNCYYVHEELVAGCEEQILLRLGCRQLDFSDITQLIEASYKEDEQERLKSASAIEQIAQWLVCLDYSLQQQREQMQFSDGQSDQREQQTIDKLKRMKIIPTKQHSHLVSVNDFEGRAVVFPLDKSTAYSKHLRLVLEDVPMLDEQLLNIIEDKHPRRVDSIKQLLKKLGITSNRNIREIYRNHLLPVMADAARWSTKSSAVLMAYLMSIYEYIYLANRDMSETDFKTLQSNALIKTRDNKVVSLGAPDTIVHLTQRYGCKRSLETMKLSKHRFTFISDDYYTEYRQALSVPDPDMRGFTAFLRELRLSDFFQVDIKEERFVDVSKLAETKWAYAIPKLAESIYEPFVIKDYVCDEFDKLVSSLTEAQADDLDSCGQLLQYLDRHHQLPVSAHYAASVYLARTYRHNPEPIQGIESSFCLSLRQHAWIPVVGGKLFKPSDVYYLPSNGPASAFRRYVPHLDESKASLSNPDFMFNILGIKREVTHQTIFELLMKWSCGLDSEALWSLFSRSATLDPIPCTLPNTFRQSCLDSIENLGEIYQFLCANADTRLLLQRFRLWPLIFVPRDAKTGDFVFAQQTFWSDPLALLSNQNVLADSSGRIPIGFFYGNNPTMPAFFVNILGVAAQPSVDDYLPLLSNVQNTDRAWQIIEAITRLTIEQNKHKEVREKLVNLSFIPCMGAAQPLKKFTDHPYYPHDMDVANLFVDVLSIIKLPSFDLSGDFKKQFCVLFTIEELSNVIQTHVDVDNGQPSTFLADFYSHSIELIQDFLLRNNLISAERSSHLATILASLRFLCVDRIHLSYCYGADVSRRSDSSFGVDAYVDQRSGKFYILKKYETSEMRYMNTMVEFLLDDATARQKLLSHMSKLLHIYQNNGEQGLAKMQENVQGNYEPKWTVPAAAEKETTASAATIEKEERVVEKPIITTEKIEQLAGERSRRPPPRPKEAAKDSEESSLTSFPLRAGAVESTAPATAKKAPDTASSDISPAFRLPAVPSDADDARVPEKAERESGEQVVAIDRGERRADANRTERPPTDEHPRSRGPLNISDLPTLPPPCFEHITASTLVDLDSLASASPAAEDSIDKPSLRPYGDEADLLTGRQGERLVYEYLKQKHRGETVEWLNETSESGGPYDIRLTFKSDDNRVEFIEVKTTRTRNQNTFPLSIGEVEYLLQHQANYFIYRVYYADDKSSRTITVINKVRENLQRKHLKLSMTVVANTNVEKQ